MRFKLFIDPKANCHFGSVGWKWTLKAKPSAVFFAFTLTRGLFHCGVKDWLLKGICIFCQIWLLYIIKIFLLTGPLRPFCTRRWLVQRLWREVWSLILYIARRIAVQKGEDVCQWHWHLQVPLRNFIGTLHRHFQGWHKNYRRVSEKGRLLAEASWDGVKLLPVHSLLTLVVCFQDQSEFTVNGSPF